MFYIKTLTFSYTRYDSVISFILRNSSVQPTTDNTTSVYSAQSRNKFQYLNYWKSSYLRYPFFYDMTLSYRADDSRCLETMYWSPLIGSKCSRARQNTIYSFFFQHSRFYIKRSQPQKRKFESSKVLRRSNGK